MTALLALALLACTGAAPRPLTPPPPRPNLLLVTLDTTRADRLGSYGHARADTPTLDALAAAGRRYTRAYSPLPLTIPAHATLLTGLQPPRHGIRTNGDRPLAASLDTLAERLQAAGYATGAAVAAYVTSRAWGFDQGYASFAEPVPDGEGSFWHASRPAGEVIDDALAWLGARDDRPWHLWVHLYDPHLPYAPPDGYVDPEDPRPYDGELAYVDDELARLFAAIDRDRTVVVVVGDHGESLGEHGELTHGLYVYEATQRVPLLIRGPGIVAEVVDAPVTLADVLPIALDALELPVPDGIDGQLARTTPIPLESWELTRRFGVAPHLAVVDGRLKLIDVPEPELYDVVDDPGELRDLAADRPADVARLRGVILRRGDPPPGTPAPPPGADAEQLAALGYVASPVARAAGDWPDPKTVRPLIAAEQQAERARLAGDVAAAEAALRAAVALRPDVAELWTRLAGLLGSHGRDDEARAVVAAGRAAAPDDPHLLLLEAHALAADRRFAEAAEAYRSVAEAMPWMPRVRGLAVGALRYAGELAEAQRLALAWQPAHPDDAHLAGAFGMVLLELGQADAGRPLVQLGCTAPRPPIEACFWASADAAARGLPDQALEQLTREVRFHPGHVRAAATLAYLASQLGAWEQQLTGATTALHRAPDRADLWYLRTLALFNLERFAEARVAVAEGLARDPGSPDLLLMDANLLAKAGLRPAGEERFAEAQEALAARTGLSRDEVGLPSLDAAPDAERPGFEAPP